MKQHINIVFLIGMLLGLDIFAANADSRDPNKPPLISLHDFKKMVLAESQTNKPHQLRVWYRFRDFSRLIKTLTPDEVKDYERAQSKKLGLREDTQSDRLILEVDLTAFKRAYPELAPVFDDSEIEFAFIKHYQRQYSYGWRRRQALIDRQFAETPANSLGKNFVPLVLENKPLGSENPMHDNLSPQNFFEISLIQLAELAICDGYKPAVQDVLRSLRVNRELQLSSSLSYLLLLRARAHGLRLIFEKKWREEIDQVLTENEKQKYASLMTSNEKLKAELAFCGN